LSCTWSKITDFPSERDGWEERRIAEEVRRIAEEVRRIAEEEQGIAEEERRGAVKVTGQAAVDVSYSIR
jgi:uncharacterized protein YdaU (DUF1376 family)